MTDNNALYQTGVHGNNAGYDSTIQTTGESGNLKYMRRNTKNYDEFSYFLSGIDVTDQNLDQMTPYVPGISRIYFHKTPYFMAKQFPAMTNNFRSYLETGFKEVSGIQDIDVEFIDIEGGWAGQKFSNISLARDNTDEITVQLYEQTGSPVREFIETWITGARDTRSGVAHYHGAVQTPANEDGIAYCEKNHTGEFIYMTLDPTAKYIEYACMFAHVMPTKVPKSHLNYTSGNRQDVVMDLSFKVTKYESKYINDIAAWYLANDELKYSYLDFNPASKKEAWTGSAAYQSAPHAFTKTSNTGAGTTPSRAGSIGPSMRTTPTA